MSITISQFVILKYSMLDHPNPEKTNPGKQIQTNLPTWIKLGENLANESELLFDVDFYQNIARCEIKITIDD